MRIVFLVFVFMLVASFSWAGGPDELHNSPLGRLYRFAAIQGNSVAMVKLAILYANGSGVEKNYKAALYWLILARSEGSKKLAELLDLIENQTATNVGILQVIPLLQSLVNMNELTTEQVTSALMAAERRDLARIMRANSRAFNCASLRMSSAF